MPALLDIRRRIRSVKSTQQITRAMKMIAAAKLRRAQESIFAARPYARRMLQLLNSLATRADHDAHPLLMDHDGDRAMLVVITADKGMCGAFNGNIIRQATRFLDANKDRDIQLSLVGRKGRDHFRRRSYRVRSEHVGIFQALKFPVAQQLAAQLIDAYTKREVDEIHLVYNEFKSIVQQRIRVEQLLPIQPIETRPEESDLDYIYEPGPARIFEKLVPKHVEVQVWRALLESAAAEHGARMAAMDAATKNAGEMIDNLTLHMNKVRQAAITREIIEVVSGAGA